MDKLEQFFDVVKREMTVTLATAASVIVSMRVVSPVCYRGAVLFFTNSDSKKYRQLAANPHCCVGAGAFFAEAAAEFCGPTMAAENAELRRAYCEKFPGAFDEGVAFGGRDAEFILLSPTRLSGWAFENDTPVEGGIPTVPFDIPIA